jgi:hypothetical protein
LRRPCTNTAARWLGGLDLASYEDVKANAAIILGQINGSTGVFMPPPPFDPFPQSFIDAFSDWMNNGYPP